MDRLPTALLLAYDGAGFRGWQRQPGLPTVQAAVEQALGEALGARIEVHGAARTDAGVHAEGQVCHFVRQSLGPAEVAGFAAVLRERLPPAIRLVAAAAAAPSFHARSSSTGKRYRYRFSWGAAPEEARAFHLGRSARPDWARARAALEGLTGLPALPGLGSPSKDRRPAPPLAAWSLEEAPGPGAAFAAGADREPAEGDAPAGGCALLLRAPAFRKHQVRNLAGHLAAVALGLATPESLAGLARRTRPWMGATAPPHGLTLVAVDYPAALDPFGAPPGPEVR